MWKADSPDKPSIAAVSQSTANQEQRIDSRKSAQDDEKSAESGDVATPKQTTTTLVTPIKLNMIRSDPRISESYDRDMHTDKVC